jgi:hypothetical protein
MQPEVDKRPALLQAAFVVLGTYAALSMLWMAVLSDGPVAASWWVFLPSLCAFYSVATAGAVVAFRRRPSLLLRGFAAAGALVSWAFLAATLGFFLSMKVFVALATGLGGGVISGYPGTALFAFALWLAFAVLFLAGLVVAGRISTGRWRPWRAA